MTRKKKIILVATACIVLGAALAAIGFARAVDGGQWSEGTSSLQTREVRLTEEFSALSVQTLSDSIRLCLSGDGEARVVCVEDPERPYSVEVAHGALTVRSGEFSTHWYENILNFGIGFGAEPSVTLYLPEGEYGALSAETASGDIAVEPGLCFLEADVETTSGALRFDADALGAVELISTSGDVQTSGTGCAALTAKSTSGAVRLTQIAADELTCETSSGDITVEDASVTGALRVKTLSGRVEAARTGAGSATFDAVSGDVSASEVLATGALCVKTTSGEISLDRCDGETLDIRSTSGTVRGSICTDKEFRVETVSGGIDVPYGRAGAGVCRVETTSGDVRLTVGEAE